MQDLQTGELRALPAKLVEGLNESSHPDEFAKRAAEACTAIEPDKSRHGPVFYHGQVLEIQGGKFSVVGIKCDSLILKSLPKSANG